MATRSDQELLVAARRDPDAFGALYRRHVDAIIRYFRRQGTSAEQAIDLTAETFAAALQGIASYTPGPEPGLAWLYAIARNTLAQSARRGRVENEARLRLHVDPLHITDEGIATIEELGDADTLRHDLKRAMRDLPDRQRDAVQARLVDDREYADIANQLACSEHLVRQHVSRGLRRLRKALREEQP